MKDTLDLGEMIKALLLLLFFGLLNAASIQNAAVSDDDYVSVSPWTVYRSRFDQGTSSPVACFERVSAVLTAKEMWNSIGGAYGFFNTKRIDYDVFRTSSSHFDGLADLNRLDFDYLSSISGVTISFLFNIPNRDFLLEDVHRFDGLLDALFDGSAQTNPELEQIFGFTLSRKFSNTVLKLWVATSHIRGPFYSAIENLVLGPLGSAKFTGINRFCKRVVTSTGFTSMPPSPVISPVSKRQVDPSISFAEIASGVIKQEETSIAADLKETEAKKEMELATQSEFKNEMEIATQSEIQNEVEFKNESEESARQSPKSEISTSSDELVLPPLPELVLNSEAAIIDFILSTPLDASDFGSLEKLQNNLKSRLRMTEIN